MKNEKRNPESTSSGLRFSFVASVALAGLIFGLGRYIAAVPAVESPLATQVSFRERGTVESGERVAAHGASVSAPDRGRALALQNSVLSSGIQSRPSVPPSVSQPPAVFRDGGAEDTPHGATPVPAAPDLSGPAAAGGRPRSPQDSRVALGAIGARFVEVDRRSAGNALKVDGIAATVTGMTRSSDETPGSLEVEIEDGGETAPTGRVATAAHSHRPGAGFTYEEELFRAKWGWAAFDQVRRAVREGQTQ